MNNREKIIAAFQDIKRRGFIPSHRTHDTGIGKTFEDLIGIIENNERRPDLNGYEIKTKRETSTSYSTLFTKSPSYPKRANAYLRDRYGEVYEEFPGLKKNPHLHIRPPREQLLRSALFQTRQRSGLPAHSNRYFQPANGGNPRQRHILYL